MRTLKGLVIGVALLCVFWTIPAHATVDWEDGFEYANDAALGAVWPHSCLGNPGVSTLRPFSGSKSLRLVFTGHVGIDPNMLLFQTRLPTTSNSLRICPTDRETLTRSANLLLSE